MAVTMPRRRARDPEGRMPLAEHLAELRRRLMISAAAVVLGAIGGWFIYPAFFEAVQQPLLDAARDRGITANVNFGGISDPFNLRFKLSIYIGIVLSSPVWLYQAWAFVLPGLTSKERRYSLGFVAVAVPLFLGGILLAWLVIPNAVEFFAEFVPEGSSLLSNASEYLLFVTRVLLAFGVAFLLPLFLVALNMIGVVAARTLLKGWRIAVFTAFLFAAIASPSPEVGAMIAMAVPMILLYFLSVGFAFLVDRRRERRAAADPLAGLSDDEASPL